MKTSLLCKRFLIVCLLSALLTGCAIAAPETPTPEPTATSVPPTPEPTATSVPPTSTPVLPTATPKLTSCEKVEGICLELTFDGESCTYKGPTDLEAGPVTLVFLNESDGIATTNMVRLLEDKTFQDIIDYSGEEPSTKNAPAWSVSVPGVRTNIEAGDSHIWKGVLEPGIHVLVCAKIRPFGVWIGDEFTVEE